ncbi:MAG: hypothetical protein R3B70_45815 [Polyangiaceae bacterium]
MKALAGINPLVDALDATSLRNVVVLVVAPSVREPAVPFPRRGPRRCPSVGPGVAEVPFRMASAPVSASSRRSCWSVVVGRLWSQKLDVCTRLDREGLEGGVRPDAQGLVHLLELDIVKSLLASRRPSMKAHPASASRRPYRTQGGGERGPVGGETQDILVGEAEDT